MGHLCRAGKGFLGDVVTENESRNQLMGYSSEQRTNLKANAKRRLKINSSDLDAQRILQELRYLEKV